MSAFQLNLIVLVHLVIFRYYNYRVSSCECVCSNNSYILYYCNLYNLCVIFKFALAPSIAVSFCVDTLQDIPTYSGLLVLTTIAIDAVALPIM